jgi:diacylglycerol kinase (ATP)
VGTLLVLLAGWRVGLNGNDWCWVIAAISSVWIAEAINTSLECLADAVSLEYHPLIRDAKDVGAGAVLLTAIAATIVGAIVFFPYIADNVQ